MTTPPADPSVRRERRAEVAVALLALLLAVAGVRSYAGSWNDGSRLATVECLVDYHTLAIDRSIFVATAEHLKNGGVSPYDPTLPQLDRDGTGDKMLVRGHFYSDKGPAPALWMAGCYWLWQKATGWTAASHPHEFVWFITLTSSGLAYALSVWLLFRLGRRLQLPLGWRLAWTASFALCTFTAAYARYVNNHILFLAFAVPLMSRLALLGEESRAGRVSYGLLFGIGLLAGFGYTTDLGVGPVLVLALLPLVAWRCRSVRGMIVFCLGLLPSLVLHHTLNYAVGGTLKPANSVPEYFNYPGSGFNAQDLTGSSIKHADPLDLAGHAAEMLFGNIGFLTCNPPLYLASLGLVLLLFRRRPETPELLFSGAWCSGSLLLYAATATWLAGTCCSIRWFLPLLAPLYFALAVLLREYPRRRKDFVLLSAAGLLLGVWMWYQGAWMLLDGEFGTKALKLLCKWLRPIVPWTPGIEPYFWPLVAPTLAVWAIFLVYDLVRWWRSRG
jgi:hypothetical protein